MRGFPTESLLSVIGQGRDALNLPLPLPSVSWLVSRHPTGGQLDQVCHWPMNLPGGGTDTWGGTHAPGQEETSVSPLEGLQI